MYRIGCVGIDTSHPTAFINVMREAQLDMAYSAVFNDGFRSDAEVAVFMEKAGLKTRCKTLEELVDQVDIGFIHDCNWDRHLDLAAPFIAAKKPVFIDKPIVGSLADCLRIEALAANGAVMLGGSSLRYAYEMVELRETLAAAGEQPMTVYGTCGVDEFNYGIHIVEAIHGLLGPGAQCVTYLGQTAGKEAPIEQFLIEWNSNTRAIYQIQTGPWQPNHVIVQTQKNVHYRAIDITKVYDALLRRIEGFLKGAPAPTAMPVLTEAVRICLAGKKSKEREGLPVLLTDLTESDAGFNGSAFERAYAAANPPPRSVVK